MRGTGEFFTSRYKIVLPKTQPFSIAFFGDVHQYSEHHCDSTWSRFKETYKRRKDVYYVGMGDYTDLLSTSERWAQEAASYHTSTRKTMQDWYCKMTDMFCDEISFMRGKLIGLIEGNHFMEFKNRTTSTQRMCDNLGCDYLGECAAVSVSVAWGSAKNPPSRRLSLALHHGRGAGRLAGSGFNTVEQMSRVFEGFDVYAMGDNHQRGGIPIQTLRMIDAHGAIKPRIESHKIMLLRTGAFLRSYIDGKASYVVDALMPPSNLGWVEVRITPSLPRLGDKSDPNFRECKLDLEVIA